MAIRSSIDLFLRGVPIQGTAGRNATTGFDYFLRGVPYPVLTDGNRQTRSIGTTFSVGSDTTTVSRSVSTTYSVTTTQVKETSSSFALQTTNQRTTVTSFALNSTQTHNVPVTFSASAGTINFVPTSFCIAEANLTTLLVLKPGESKDNAGTITPTETGTPTSVAGRYADNAWDFDAGDELTVPHIDHVHLGRGSIAAWIKADNVATGSTQIVWQVSDGTSEETRLWLSLTSAGSLRFNVKSGSAAQTFYTFSAPTSGQWYLVYVAWNDTSASWSINGESINTTAMTVPYGSNKSVIRLGTATGSTFAGQIGPFIVNDRPMTQTQLNELYTRTTPWTLLMDTDGFADIKRSISTTYTLSYVDVRSLTSTFALSNTFSSDIVTEFTLQTTNKRSIPSTYTIQATENRIIPIVFALQTTQKRIISSNFSLTTILQKTVPNTFTLQTTNRQEISSEYTLKTIYSQNIPTAYTIYLIDFSRTDIEPIGMYRQEVESLSIIRAEREEIIIERVEHDTVSMLRAEIDSLGVLALANVLPITVDRADVEIPYSITRSTIDIPLSAIRVALKLMDE